MGHATSLGIGKTNNRPELTQVFATLAFPFVGYTSA